MLQRVARLDARPAAAARSRACPRPRVVRIGRSLALVGRERAGEVAAQGKHVGEPESRRRSVRADRAPPREVTLGGVEVARPQVRVGEMQVRDELSGVTASACSNSVTVSRQ